MAQVEGRGEERGGEEMELVVAENERTRRLTAPAMA